MASKYSKTYTRRKGTTSQMTQFDKLLGDPGKSTHPIASKTAGHVGKWGTTSFTSLRGINGSHGPQDSVKRQRTESEMSSDDAYCLDSLSVEAPAEKPVVQVKKRKFFKSRDQNSAQSVPAVGSNHKPNSGGRESPPVPVGYDKSDQHPSKAPASGIKLKIYKSRNTETTDVYSSKVELPSDESNSSTSRASTPTLKFAGNNLAEDMQDIMDEVTLRSPQHSTKITLPETTSCAKHLDSPLDFDIADTPPATEAPKTEDPDTKLSEEDTCALDTFDINTGSSSKELYGGSVDLFGTDFDEEEVVDRTQIDYFGSTKDEDSPPIPTQDSQSTNLTEEILEKPSNEDFLEAESKTEVPSETTNKKRSIFKSRTTLGNSNKRAMYRHKWHSQDEKEENADPKLQAAKSLSSSDPPKHGALESTSLQRVQTWPSTNPYDDDDFADEFQPTTSVKCPKEAKKYYTVIKNVKKTHQLQESGEFQEFNDDVDYFLDALKNTNAVSTRCLASLNLAQKCMTPAFRMHLRAHGTVIKFFKALSDAHTHLHLGESVAMVMYVLSQDHLNMDLDRESLELMLNLLDTDGLNQKEVSSSDSKKKVNQLCKELQQKGYAKHLDLHNVNAATLAMETLLSLTSKRAGEWFKEELRTLGGVDHLMRTVMECCSCFSTDMSSWNAELLAKLSKAERCLKVLENVTHLNATNQEYLLTKLNKKFCGTLMHLYKMGVIEVPLYATTGISDSPTLKALLSAHITTMKVLINVTHGIGKEALGSKMLGADTKVYDLTLNCLLVLPPYLEHDTKFEIQVLACCLLLNLIENSPQNRATLMALKAPDWSETDLNMFDKTPRKTAMEELVALFHSSNKSALEQEAHTDQIIDQDLDQDSQEEEKKDEDIADTVARLLQKAGRHMEDTLIAAYSALLAGFCVMDNQNYTEQIRELQPDKDFKNMVTVLKKFLHFMKLTATTSLLRSLKPTEKVVAFMENLDKKPEETAQEQDELDFP